MGDWIGLLMAYGGAVITIATIILGATFVIRRQERARAASRPVLVVSDGAKRRRPAA